MALTKPRAGQINFDAHNVTDPLIRINSGQSGANDKDVGFVFERGSDTNVSLFWDESADQFVLVNTTEDGTTSGDVTISSYADLALKKITQSEQQYTTSNMMKFNQIYTGASIGSYFEQNEYQKILTITPAGNAENYQVTGRIIAQSASSIQTIDFNVALRSETLPDLNWSITYTDTHNGTAFFKPQLWTKETTTAGFIFAIQKISSGSLYGTVTVDIDVIPRTSALKSNVTMNTTQNSEQTSVDAGYTANDMTKIMEINGDNIDISAHDGSSNGLELAGTLVTATAAELNYTDGVTSNIQTQLDAKLASASYTASDVLTKIKTVDGTGSGLDADTLDGNEATAFALLSGATFTGAVSGTNLTLSGDLTVNGTTTTLNTTNTVVSDNLIELNNGVSSNANDSGIVIERGSTGDNAFIGWDESADKFIVGTTTATGASTGDLTITVAPLETGALGVTGNITVSGTVDGRDVATDGSKLDGIEEGADVTDTANVTSAGALMDSEVDADIKTLSLPANTTITAFGATLVDDADASAALVTLGLTATAAELNYTDGVTSNIQTQLDAKAPTASPTFTGTDGIVIPSGTTAQRPVSPATGTMRFNTTDGRFEGYNGTAWVPIDTLYS